MERPAVPAIRQTTTTEGACPILPRPSRKGGRIKSPNLTLSNSHPKGCPISECERPGSRQMWENQIPRPRLLSPRNPNPEGARLQPQRDAGYGAPFKPSVGLSGITTPPTQTIVVPRTTVILTLSIAKEKDPQFQRSRNPNKSGCPTSRVWDVGKGGRQSAPAVPAMLGCPIQALRWLEWDHKCPQIQPNESKLDLVPHPSKKPTT